VLVAMPLGFAIGRRLGEVRQLLLARVQPAGGTLTAAARAVTRLRVRGVAAARDVDPGPLTVEVDDLSAVAEAVAVGCEEDVVELARLIEPGDYGDALPVALVLRLRRRRPPQGPPGPTGRGKWL
jgi:hypothetical protein